MSISCITISQDTIDNTSWYFIRQISVGGGTTTTDVGCFPISNGPIAKLSIWTKNNNIKNKSIDIKISLPASLTNRAMLPGNGARKRSLMTLNVKGSIVASLISKSVEPNELIGD